MPRRTPIQVETTAEPLKLSELISVVARFGRSVNLERDFYSQATLDEYVLTITARDTLERFYHGLENNSGVRAFTLTGPFGAGKSAFALFAAKVLSYSSNASAQSARLLIKSQDKELWQSLFDRRRKGALGEQRLCPVLVSGSREPIDRALLRGLARALEEFFRTKPPRLLGEVKQLLSVAEAGEQILARRLSDVFEQAAKKIRSSHTPGSGLLIVIDELGKLLEYAAAHPQSSDIFILQELAEAAKRSTDHPILLVTILHQAFDRYAEKLSRAQRDEWMKIQGRFEDVPFQEPTEQLLRILARGISRHGPESAIQSINTFGERLAEQAEELGIIPKGAKKDAVELLTKCSPLHPTVALILGHLFRRLGQNERSLFVYLSSHEPHGFQDFLANNVWSEDEPAVYTLDRLYDYVVTALGSGLYAQGNGRKWAEIESALDRLARATELEVKLVKIIGLLRVIGDIGDLKPSKMILQYALASAGIKSDQVDYTLEQLRRKSIIVYRQYSGGYSLWDGSDIDIDEKIGEARARIDFNESLAISLTKHFKPRPVIARQHSFITGTLRFFDVRYAQLDEFEKALIASLGDADGSILYAVASNEYEIGAFNEKAAALIDNAQVLIAIPQEIGGLREAVFEVECLKWVKDNTPELEGDRVARSELRARLANTEELVENLIQSFFHPSSQELGGGETCKWFHKGTRVQFASDRAFQEFISRICNEVYLHTPILRNELINRRQISASAASARRYLIKGMLDHSDKEDLGIEGTPPQMSMYYSILQETHLHRREGERWGFYPPPADQPIAAMWAEMDAFFASTEKARRPITELFEILKRPPYGLKEGPLPVLLCAALLHYDSEVALYEQDSFVPKLSIALFERLVRAPENFKIQRCRVAGVREVMFRRFAEILLQSPDRILQDRPNLLAVVRPLLHFSHTLPLYTQNTQRLSPTTLRVRDVLSRTREPDHLLFEQLPAACGLSPFLPDDVRSSEEIDRFFKTLRASLSELQRAYHELLVDLEGMIIAAFSLKSAGDESREELRTRCRPLFELTVEPKLKSFIIRAIDESLDLIGWRESTATFFVGRPPAEWNDTDLARFQVTLAEISRSFLNIESLSFELRNHDSHSDENGNEVIRLGVTTLDAPESQRVLFIDQADAAFIESAKSAVKQTLVSEGIAVNSSKGLAVLAKLSHEILQQMESEHESNDSQKPSVDVKAAYDLKEVV
jgi:hypothetical protein